AWVPGRFARKPWQKALPVSWAVGRRRCVEALRWRHKCPVLLPGARRTPARVFGRSHSCAGGRAKGKGEPCALIDRAHGIELGGPLGAAAQGGASPGGDPPVCQVPTRLPA